LITSVGFSGRDCISTFQKRFYEKYAVNAIIDSELNDFNFGKSLSAFVFVQGKNNILFVFDADDGSGGTATDCKISWPNYNKVVEKYNTSDVIFIKLQCAKEPEYHQFFPFKYAIPLGLMTNDPEKTISSWNLIPDYEKDIDVIFIGGKVHDRNKVYCWPTHRSLDAWWPGVRKKGYEKLLELKERRKDINIFCTDEIISPEEYYKLIKRSKICIDLPGTARSSRKFYEFLMFGKCVISLPQQESILSWKEGIHYFSLGWDFGFEKLESSIDNLLGNPDIISQIEKNASDLSQFMTHSSLVEILMKNIEKISKDRSHFPVYNTVLRP